MNPRLSHQWPHPSIRSTYYTARSKIDRSDSKTHYFFFTDNWRRRAVNKVNQIPASSFINHSPLSLYSRGYNIPSVFSLSLSLVFPKLLLGATTSLLCSDLSSCLLSVPLPVVVVSNPIKVSIFPLVSSSSDRERLDDDNSLRAELPLTASSRQVFSFFYSSSLASFAGVCLCACVYHLFSGDCLLQALNVELFRRTGTSLFLFFFLCIYLD